MSLDWPREGAVPSLRCHPLHAKPVCSSFPCFSALWGLLGNGEERTEGFGGSGRERREAKAMESSKSQLQGHLSCLWLGVPD